MRACLDVLPSAYCSRVAPVVRRPPPHPPPSGWRAGGLSGADAHVTKPFSIDTLRARLARLLEAHWAGARDDGTDNPPSPDVEATAADEQFLDRVATAIDDHLSYAEFTVDDLAAEVGLSPRQLQRKLKRITGTTPAAFVRRYRLDVAAQLLEQEAGTVSEVAYEVGFGTPETFTTRFEERFGCCPSAYPDAASSDAASSDAASSDAP